MDSDAVTSGFIITVFKRALVKHRQQREEGGGMQNIYRRVGVFRETSLMDSEF